VRPKILLDCDPGHDDAIAMLLAHGNPDVDLIAVTTVVGNSSLPNVTRNALAIATVAGITGVPFAAGCDRPLLGHGETAPGIHGESGLDGPVLPPASFDLDRRHAVDLIIDTVLDAEPGTVTLVPVGGLTNIALAARKEPRIVELVREVVLMGGAYGPGNMTPTAEFNIAIDPEAAQIVFSESWPVTMVGLDVTHRALADRAVQERIAALGTAPARFVLDMLAFYGEAYRDTQDFPSPPVHDACAVAYVIDRAVLEVQRAPIAVELTGTLTRGTTVVDLRPFTLADEDVLAGCTTSVATGIDAGRLWDLLVDALERIGDPRPNP
jgi:purine nucleosidase